jgi:mRNA-degrading endonuclease RelE of RelBE toxin-antitoxin system
MSWDCRLSKAAAKELARLPRDRQQQIADTIAQMRSDPLGGDVLPIKSGKFKGALRRRSGRYRIIFSVDVAQNIIEIAAILIRTEKTYR